MPRNSLGRNIAFCMAGIAAQWSPAAFAQQQGTQGGLPQNLPRLGYDYDGLHLSGTTVLAEAQVGVTYDSNVFATSVAEQDDAAFAFSPSVTAERRIGKTNVEARGYARVLRFAELERENSEAFGASLRAGHGLKELTALNALIQYDRVIEGRADPETRAGPTDRPRKVDSANAEIGLRHVVGRLTTNLTGAVQKLDFLDPGEADRDMRTYRAAMRVGYRVAASLEVIGEAYVNRRDFRLATDFSGVNRDTTTYGFQVGVRREIGNRLRGRIGLGIFRAEPDSALVDGYTGFGANGEVTWSPRARTALTFRVSRGDVATVRFGATTRIDSVARLTVDQEIRHNLLARVSVSYADQQFRGSARGHLKSAAGEGQIEYLLNRRMSVVGTVDYTDRSARLAADRFKRLTVGVGVRYKL